MARTYRGAMRRPAETLSGCLARTRNNSGRKLSESRIDLPHVFVNHRRNPHLKRTRRNYIKREFDMSNGETQPAGTTQPVSSRKSWVAALLFSILLGTFGVDRFY